METRVIIVDDEERSIIALQQLFEKYCSGVIVEGTATNITDAVKIIKKTQPHAVFLDIEMQGGNGFKLLEQFEEPDFETVFITAYQEYAIKAIKFAALDYLLKPVKISELRSCIENIKKKQIGLHKEKYAVLKDTINHINAFNKIILSTLEGFYPVKIEEIIYCKADDSYTHFFLQNGKRYTVSRQLKDYEEMLTNNSFFRIHKSFLINLNHVNKVNKADGASVVMSNNDILPLAFRKKDEFFEKLRSL
jgi:two-component system LytT family response regulator